MTANLVIWAWSTDFDTPAKRKKHKLKFDQIEKSRLPKSPRLRKSTPFWNSH
jgi:hypothetical protein